MERAKRAKSRFFNFVLFTTPNYLPGWVHQDICDRLDRFLEGVLRKESPRLMLFMPPRHGKSELVSRKFPAYALGRNPDLSIIASSYSADLASRMNRDVQRVIDSEPYRQAFPDTCLFGKNIRSVADGSYLRNSDIFEVVGRQGVYRATGVGGGITGMGADILDIDDPIKDAKEADSATVRQSIWDWYTSTALTRLSPGGGVLLTLTRWHEDDLAGRLLQAAKEGGDEWEVVVYPAIAEQNEAHRQVGEALHPDRYPLPMLQKIKGAVGSRVWEALYQQRPSAAEGGLIKRDWFKVYKQDPKTLGPFDEVVQSWDFTFKDSKASDYVVGQVWGRKGADKYLLDQVRARMDFPASLQALRTLSAKWPEARLKLIEDKANGPAIIATAQREIEGLVPVEPQGSKEARVSAASPSIESGNVHIPHPEQAPWVHDFIEECAAFPNGAHDDQVDAMAQALLRLGRGGFYFV